MQEWRQETATTVFSCEYCDIFKRSFFHKSLPRTPHKTFLIQTTGGVLWKNFLKISKLTGKLCQSLFFNKVAGLGAASLLKMRLCTGVSWELLRIPFFTSGSCLYWLPKTESTVEFTKNFLWNQISLICDNQLSRLFKVLLFVTFYFRGI